MLSDQEEFDLALKIIEMIDTHAPAAGWEATRKDAILGALTKLLREKPIFVQRPDIAIAAAKELVQVQAMYQFFIESDTKTILESCVEHLHTPCPFPANDVFPCTQTFDAQLAQPIWQRPEAPANTG